jgi:hypothetical protein
MKIYYAFLFLLSLFVVSCSPVYSYFTDDLYQEQKWSQEDVQRIQFYLSKDIVLSRTLADDQASIKEGKITIKNDSREELLVVKSGTPGVLVMMPKEDRFGISFENDDQAYLMFGPNPKMENHYCLLAQEWAQDHGEVHYKDNLYYVNAESADACLMIDLKKTGNEEHVNQVVSGRKLKK